ncbi:MAG: sulfur carrier protein ThiS adenylyltransferase ThiF [Elusimicrobia bacterium]|nr:sulfur carrier protein ThiS adenylyltransferase ThiF [Elusimicrobiota bacterium]
MPNPFTEALSRYLTDTQLAKIRATPIGIAGAGGLGSNVAMTLVRSGFVRFEILDKDAVEASNLNRQDYTLTDIGRPKVEALKMRMLAVNPDALIVTHQAEWTRANADAFLTGLPILVEAFDQAEIKREFTEWAIGRTRCVVSGNGMAGLTGGDPTTVRQINNLYIVGDGTTSIHDGHPPLAPRVLQCAAKMAEIVLSRALEK